MKLYNVIVISTPPSTYYIQFLPYYFIPKGYIVLSSKSVEELQYLCTHGDIIKINEIT